MKFLTRGKRWSVEEERVFEDSVKAGVSIVEISKRLGRSIVGVRDKISHFGLEDDTVGKLVPSSSLSSSSSPRSGGEDAEAGTPSSKVLSAGLTSVEASSQPDLPALPVLGSAEVLSSPGGVKEDGCCRGGA